MNTKIEDVQKSYESLSKEKNSKTTTDVRNNIVIRNLRYDEREKDNSEVTKNLVQSMFRHGLSLPDIDIQSVSRKGGNDRYTGVVVVELSDSNQKREIFKKKKELRKSRNYSKVYIDNDMPLETRIFQGNVRTLLKEIGKDQELMFVGNKLVQKKH